MIIRTVSQASLNYLYFSAGCVKERVLISKDYKWWFMVTGLLILGHVCKVIVTVVQFLVYTLSHFFVFCCLGKTATRREGMLVILLSSSSSSSSSSCAADRPVDDEDPVWTKGSCSWRDTGKLNYDIYRRSLQVCFSGVWQSILQHTGESPLCIIIIIIIISSSSSSSSSSNDNNYCASFIRQLCWFLACF